MRNSWRKCRVKDVDVVQQQDNLMVAQAKKVKVGAVITVGSAHSQCKTERRHKQATSVESVAIPNIQMTGVQLLAGSAIGAHIFWTFCCNVLGQEY